MHPGWGRVCAREATEITTALFQPLADTAHRIPCGISMEDKKWEADKEEKYRPFFFFFSILKENFKMQICISLSLTLIHHQSFWSNSNLILSTRMHRGLLPQPQSAHTDMLQDIFQIPPAEPGLKSTHKQENTGYINRFLLKTKLAGRQEVKNSLLHHLWHRLWNTTAYLWSLLFQVIYLKDLSVQPNTGPQQKASRQYKQSVSALSLGLFLPNILIFPFPLSLMGTYW